MRTEFTGRVLTLFTFLLLLGSSHTVVASPDNSPQQLKRAPPSDPGPLPGPRPAPQVTDAPTTTQPGTTTTGPSTTTAFTPNPTTTVVSTSTPTTTALTTTSLRPVITTSTIPTSITPLERTTTTSSRTLDTAQTTTTSSYLPPLPKAKSTLIFPSTGSCDPTATDDGTQATSGTSGASSQSFWKNKGAVAGVFLIVSLIGLALIFSAVTFIMRRRSNKYKDEEFFEKYPDSSHAPEDAISVHDVTTQAAVDAYPDRSIHYGSDPNHADSYSSHQHYAADTHAQAAQYISPDQYAGQPHAYSPTHGEFLYTSGTAYAQSPAAQPPTDTQAAYGFNPVTRVAAEPSSAAAYQLPAVASQQQGSSAPPVTYRDPTARQSYQQSIDSFYGAPASR